MINAFNKIKEQPENVAGLSSSERNKLLISVVNVDGNWHETSHYGDIRWHLKESTTNHSKQYGILNFSRLPEPFRDVMKEVFYRYIFRGREGQVRPTAGTLISFFGYIRTFLLYVHKLKFTNLSEISPTICKLYVNESKRILTKNTGNPIKATTLMLRFLAVEAVYELSQHTNDPMLKHPWPDTSARTLAGIRGDITRSPGSKGRTPLIPDKIFVKIFQSAWNEILNAEKILDLRDGLNELEQKLQGKNKKTISEAKRKYLIQENWSGGIIAFRSSLRSIRTACYSVVASLTGCRNHEMAFIQSNCCYSSVDDEGTIYWWMKSRSAKTGIGDTEWMIPEVGVTALRLMERWSLPYREMLKSEIERLRRANSSDVTIAEYQRHQNALFLSKTTNSKIYRTMPLESWKKEFKEFTARHEINWHITSHQFRRKFANYAARSQFGDLRYLKEHFKHWSMDMTLGYALNESQEQSLFFEIEDELDDMKKTLVGHWLKPHEQLTGGYGNSIVKWRTNSEVTVFKDHKSMVHAISESTAIRSNGHAWCTADDNFCVGNSDLEITRCVKCSNAVIDREHVHIYQGLYDQLKEILLCEDIGDAGMARVRRDLERCSDVLTELGYEPL